MPNNKSISELEGWKWNTGIPNDSNSGVERRFYKLHNIPIKDLAIDDIRFLINQNEGLKHLIPIAIVNLETNFFIETEYYEGDLINSIININLENFWKQNEALKRQIISLIINNQDKLEFIDLDWKIKKELKQNFKNFIA
ncbi:MAG: contact-dependent growth inhibition system immunity protein [Bacteroidota bacterium]